MGSRQCWNTTLTACCMLLHYSHSACELLSLSAAMQGLFSRCFHACLLRAGPLHDGRAAGDGQRARGLQVGAEGALMKG